VDDVGHEVLKHCVAKEEVLISFRSITDIGTYDVWYTSQTHLASAALAAIGTTMGAAGSTRMDTMPAIMPTIDSPAGL